MKIVPIAVDLTDSMGSDLSVVNAARVSFAKESEWEYKEDTLPFGLAPVKTEGDWYKRLSEKDQKLIQYLATHNHWSPFAHAFLSFRIKAPIFVARQLVKHQVGLAWNEESRRYIDDEPEFFFPDVWRGKPVNAKQGSAGQLGNDDIWSVSFRKVCEDSLILYEEAVKEGMAPEQARMCLPLNTMTNWIWSGSLMAFARVCNLRLDPHAQKECQDVAKLIAASIPSKFEHSWKALVHAS